MGRHKPEIPASSMFVCPECERGKDDPAGSCQNTRWHAGFALPPSISSFIPTSGPVGTSVKIEGAGFTQSTEVSFGTVKAPIGSVALHTNVTTTVPKGATTEHIHVKTPRGDAESATVFTVTE